MKSLIAPTLVAGVLLCQALMAQSGNQAYRYDRPYGDTNSARQDRALFDRARMDLDRASSYRYASRTDRRRFDDARRDLFDFTARFEQGRYDRRRLDIAIERIEAVLSHNSLDARDRGALADDVRRMRDYREFRKQQGEYEQGYR